MKWYVLLCVSLFLVACAGSCVGAALLGPNIFTGWRTAIYQPEVSVPTDTSAEVELSQDSQITPTEVAPPQENSVSAPQANNVSSLDYDETGDGIPGIASLLRIDAPISQAQLEGAIAQIQQIAAENNAETHEGSTLTLDQRVAWAVWCSNTTLVDPPSDVSNVHEPSLLASETAGRVWIQVPFDTSVPLRSDDTWTGCSNSNFWAVRVH